MRGVAVTSAYGTGPGDGAGARGPCSGVDRRAPTRVKVESRWELGAQIARELSSFLLDVVHL